MIICSPLVPTVSRLENAEKLPLATSQHIEHLVQLQRVQYHLSTKIVRKFPPLMQNLINFGINY